MIEIVGQVISFAHPWFGGDYSHLSDEEFWAGVENLYIQFMDGALDHKITIPITDSKVRQIRSFEQLVNFVDSFGRRIEWVKFMGSNKMGYHKYIPCEYYLSSFGSNSVTKWVIDYAYLNPNPEYGDIIDVLKLSDGWYVYCEGYEKRIDGPTSISQNLYEIEGMDLNNVTLDTLHDSGKWSYRYCVDDSSLTEDEYRTFAQWCIENPDFPHDWGMTLLGFADRRNLLPDYYHASYKSWPRIENNEVVSL